MLLFQRLLNAIRGRFKREPVSKDFLFDVDLFPPLQNANDPDQNWRGSLAQAQFAPGDFDTQHFEERHQRNWERWETLTPREKEVTALICLNYTTREISDKLSIHPSTVKTHREHVLTKFGVSSSETLRRALIDWDFRAWDI